MKLKSILPGVAVGCVFAFAGHAPADEVVFKNGDKLSGEVTSVGGGSLMLNSAFAGATKIGLGDVATFSTDKPVEIHLSDGTVLKRKIDASDTGSFAIGGAGLVPGTKFSIASIDTINPPPIAWTGSFRLGGELARGNTYSDTLTAGFNVGLGLSVDQFTFAGEYNYGRQKDRSTGIKSVTTDNWKLEANYQHFFTKKFYGFLDALVAKDRIAFLDLRFAPAAGVGYQWVDSAKLHFSTEGGVAWIYETYTNGSPTKEDFSLKLAYHLLGTINEHVDLFHNLTYYPSMERGSNYLITADAGLRTKLTKRLFTELKVEWDYNSTPATGSLKNDTRYLVTLGYTL